jgi:hypothetical protein
MKVLNRARYKGMQKPLEMSSLCALWMIFRRTFFEAYASLDEDKKLSIMRCTRFFLMEHGIYHNEPMVVSMCKWVFNNKLSPNGTIEKYKVRLLAKGYT